MMILLMVIYLSVRIKPYISEVGDLQFYYIAIECEPMSRELRAKMYFIDLLLWCYNRGQKPVAPLLRLRH